MLFLVPGTGAFFLLMALLLPRPPALSPAHSSLLSDGFPRTYTCPPRRTRRHDSDRRERPSICRASWQELVGVLVFSAVPFTAVKAIANSSVGETLRRRLEETKKADVEKSKRFKALVEKAREESFWYGKERPRWLGPISYEYPSHLTGEFPGDYGFDIAGLSKDRMAFEKYFNFEILHARWAMLASLGVIIPELLDQLGIVQFVEPVWWRVGYAKLQALWPSNDGINTEDEIENDAMHYAGCCYVTCLQGHVDFGSASSAALSSFFKGDTLDYLGIPGLHIAGSQGVLVIAICQALLMVGPEYARYCGIEALEPLGIYLPGDINYPGGLLFDPLGLSRDPVAFEELKVKEIKNGRLAMVAWLGFYLQAALTGKGPLQNLIEHVADPLHNNVLSTFKLM